MRLPRLKRVGRSTVYHCVSHFVQEVPYLTAREKEFFRRRMRALARFCSLQIVDYAVMSNHVHLIVRSPAAVTLTDAQLLDKLIAFYGKDSVQATGFGDVLNGRSRRRTRLREAYLKRQGDVSVFMKELKEGFTKWYNRQRQRRGTLWSARFGSQIIEDQPSVLRLCAAYVDLNSVRAGITEDPRKYRFCGYAAALAGDEEAREGLRSFLRPGSWSQQAAEYRELLFGQAGRSGHSSKRVLGRGKIDPVGQARGKLSWWELLRHKVRYFTDGTVMGSAEFVEQIWREYRKPYNPNRKTGARRMRGKVWGGLCTLRDLRKNVIQ